MGKRGPRPEPAAVKMAKGSFRPGKHSALGMDTGLPDTPDWLSPEALEIWNQMIAKLSKLEGLLSAADGEALGRYCEDWVIYLNAVETLRAAGSSVVYSEKGAPYAHPCEGFRNKAHDRMTKFESRFAMNPTDRAALKLAPPITATATEKYIA